MQDHRLEPWPEDKKWTYRAVDHDGEFCYFNFQPLTFDINGGIWARPDYVCPKRTEYKPVGNGFDPANWEKSREERDDK